MTSSITDRWPWTMRPSNLYLLVGCAAGAILLAAWIAAANNRDDLKLIADVTNVIGAVVTFLGLLYAYIRASSAAPAWLHSQRARIARGLARITGWALPTHRGQASGTITVTTHAGGYAAINFDESLDTPAQLAQLTGFVNQLSIGLANARDAIYQLPSKGPGLKPVMATRRPLPRPGPRFGGSPISSTERKYWISATPSQASPSLASGRC